MYGSTDRWPRDDVPTDAGCAGPMTEADSGGPPTGPGDDAGDTVDGGGA